MEYNSAIKKNKIVPFASPWMDLEMDLEVIDHTVLRLPDPSIARHGPSLKDRTAYHISMLITVV